MQKKNFSIKDIFSIKNEKQFNNICLQVFEHQYNYNDVYKRYVNKLNIDKSKIKHYTEIPFLPIDFFKTHNIISSNKEIQTTFRSSGTTGVTTSEHHITDLTLYEKSF
ncbi:MAG: acyl transferase, partial [Chlorobi bacterium]|nr:acyl transferase [Chlorobiota bacterium]